MEMSRRAAAISKRAATLTKAPRETSAVAMDENTPTIQNQSAARTIAEALPQPQLAGFVGERVTVDCSDGLSRSKTTLALILVLALLAMTGVFLL